MFAAVTLFHCYGQLVESVTLQIQVADLLNFVVNSVYVPLASMNVKHVVICNLVAIAICADFAAHL